MNNELIQCNCMDYMKTCKDKQFDLAIVDPPYFSGPEKRKFYGQKISPIGVQRLYRQSENWKIPDDNYFKELFRISENQIIWGWNYFNQIGKSSGRIIWDKVNGKSSFSDCEIAYISCISSVRLFRYMWNGMLQGKSINNGDIQQGDKSKNEFRIHPTQKPVALYKWLLSHYAHAGNKLFDSHSGSGSFRIAAYDMGFDLISCEIDADYCRDNEARYQAHIAQQELIPVQEIQQLTFGGKK